MLLAGEKKKQKGVCEIRIPPIEYPTIRNLVLTFLVALASKSGKDYRLKGDTFILFDDPGVALKDTMLDVISIFESRKEVSKKAEFCPKLASNRNDFDWVGNKIANKMGFTISKDITICDFFVKLIKATAEVISSYPERVVEELKSIEMKDGNIYLGRKEDAVYPQLQMLKLEKYKYGKTYLSFTEFKGQMKISPIWYSILGAGWLLSFSRFTGDALLLVYLDESAVLSRLALPGRDPGELLGALREYSVLPLKEQYPPTHTEAYTLLLYLNLDPNRIDWLKSVPAKYMKITFANVYSIVEEINFDISPVYDSIALLLTDPRYSILKDKIKDMLVCTLLTYSGRVYRKCVDTWGSANDLSAMVRSLWNIVMKMDPYTNAYRLIRISPPEGDNFRKSYIASQLFSWIEKMHEVKVS